MLIVVFFPLLTPLTRFLWLPFKNTLFPDSQFRDASRLEPRMAPGYGGTFPRGVHRWSLLKTKFFTLHHRSTVITNSQSCLQPWSSYTGGRYPFLAAKSLVTRTLDLQSLQQGFQCYISLTMRSSSSLPCTISHLFSEEGKFLVTCFTICRHQTALMTTPMTTSSYFYHYLYRVILLPLSTLL